MVGAALLDTEGKQSPPPKPTSLKTKVVVALLVSLGLLGSIMQKTHKANAMYKLGSRRRLHRVHQKHAQTQTKTKVLVQSAPQPPPEPPEQPQQQQRAKRQKAHSKDGDHPPLLRHNKHHRDLKLLQRDFVDCSKYQYSLSITEKLHIKYVVNADAAALGGGTMSVEMVYQGHAWLGFAHSETATMVGSIGVIGLPDEESELHKVQKYSLGGKGLGSVLALLPPQQTLLNTSLEQTEDFTIMRFTKLLMEPDLELTIHPNLPNTFLFAHGFDNALGLHETRGVAVLDLHPCIPSVLPEEDEGDLIVGKRRYDTGSYVIEIGGGGNERSPDNDIDKEESNIIIELSSEPAVVESVVVEPEVIVVLSEPEFVGVETSDHSLEENVSPTTKKPLEKHSTFDDPSKGTSSALSMSENMETQNSATRIWWTLHGVFAALTGILLSIALGSSMLHGCCGGKRRSSNNKLHRWASVLVVVMVIATFITAVVGAQLDSANTTPQERLAIQSTKPETRHSPAGLALFVLILFYALTATLRSCPTWTSTSDAAMEALDERKSGPSDFNSDMRSSLDLGMAKCATSWDRSHCIVGIILVGLSCWQCQTGLDLFESRFHESWFSNTLFWSLSGTTMGVIGFLCLLQLCYLIVQHCYKMAYW